VVLHIKVIFIKTNSKEVAVFEVIMAKFMKDSGKTIKRMDLDNIDGRTETNIKDFTKITKGKVEGPCGTITARFMTESGIME